MEGKNVSQCLSCHCFKETLFKTCTHDDLEKINENKIVRNYRKKQVLFEEGETAFAVFCIKSGFVKTIKKEAGDKEQILKIIGPGNNLGYHSVLAKQPYSHSAIALTDVQACLIPEKDYLEMLKNDFHHNELIQKLSLEYIETENFIKVLSFKSARERLANAILDNLCLMEEAQINISRTDLANFIGTAKETTTRLLSELKEEKIIAIEGKSIRILNKDKLEKIKYLYK